MNIEEIQNKFKNLKQDYYETNDEAVQLLEKNKKIIQAKKIKLKLANMYMIFLTTSVTALVIALACAFSGMVLPAILLAVGGVSLHLGEGKIEQLIFKFINKHILKDNLVNLSMQELNNMYLLNSTFIDLDLDGLDKIYTSTTYLFDHLLEIYPIVVKEDKQSSTLVDSMGYFLGYEMMTATEQESAKTFKRKVGALR